MTEEEQARQINFENEQLNSDWASILSTAQGQRIIVRILESCNVFAPLTLSNERNMILSEGKRQIGLLILREISAVQHIDVSAEKIIKKLIGG